MHEQSFSSAVMPLSPEDLVDVDPTLMEIDVSTKLERSLVTESENRRIQGTFANEPRKFVVYGRRSKEKKIRDVVKKRAY